MLKIGITGSIGSGKSTVCRILETLGVPVYYADDRAKYLQQYHPAVKEAILSFFGHDVYTPDGSLNRVALAAKVFADPDLLKKLEAIVHPAVRDDFRVWVQQQKTPYILKEAALLYEAGTYKELDKMITVSAPLETRLKRVMERDHSTRDQILARMARQWPDEDKIAAADYVLCNDDKQLLLPQVLRLHSMFLKGSAEAL